MPVPVPVSAPAPYLGHLKKKTWKKILPFYIVSFLQGKFFKVSSDEGNQVHNFRSSSGSGTVINYGSGCASQKVTDTSVTVPVPVPQHCR